MTTTFVDTLKKGTGNPPPLLGRKMVAPSSPSVVMACSRLSQHTAHGPHAAGKNLSYGLPDDLKKC